MKTYNDIKELGEEEIFKLLKNNEISFPVYEEWQLKTPIFKRTLKNNSVWDTLSNNNV